jgi:hypothetical protein
MGASEIESKLKKTTKDEVNDQEAVKEQAFREAAVEYLFTQPEFKEKTENFLSKFSDFIEPNPRSMKRLVTAFGLWRARDILSGSYSDEDKLAQWVILSQRWPLMANFLEEHPGIADIIKDKPRKEWEKILEENNVDKQDRELFLDPAICNILLGKGDSDEDIGKPLDSDTIRKLASL